jgi:hypothetical protein
MLHLLMDTSIFIPLPNGCLCQVTGEPIVFLTSVERRIPSEVFAVHHDNGTKRPRPDSLQDERPAKRRKLQIKEKFGARRGPAISIQYVSSLSQCPSSPKPLQKVSYHSRIGEVEGILRSAMPYTSQELFSRRVTTQT